MDGASCSSAQATTLPALAARVPPPVMAEATTQIAADPKAAATYGDDWRSQLQRDARSRIISKMYVTQPSLVLPIDLHNLNSGPTVPICFSVIFFYQNFISILLAYSFSSSCFCN